MGYLAQIVLALVAQASAEAGLRLDGERLWLVLALCFAPHALGKIVHVLFVRGRFKLGELVYRLLVVAGPLLFFAAHALGGWQAIVKHWTGHDASFLQWPDLSLALAFLPFLVYEVLSIDACSRIAAGGAERKRWRSFNARMFLSGLVPIAIYILAASLIGLSEPLRVHIEETRLWNAVFASALLLTLGLLLPFLLRTTWETAPLPEGPQKELLLAVADLARFEKPRLFVWKTGHLLANAAIVGVTPRSRVVLFSDSLLAQMAPKELAAVFAHEMGHAFRRHVPIFLTWVLAFFLGADWIAERLFPDDALWAGGTVLAIMSVWFFSFGWLSRRFELDADLFSLDLLGETRSLISALEKVGGRLRDVASWRHFSTAERVLFLERAQLDPSIARKLRRDLGRWAMLGVGLFALTLVLQIVRLVGALPEDRVRVDLHLGDYAAAIDGAQRVENLDPAVASMVRCATSLGAEHVTIGALARRALAAFDEHEIETARCCFALGALRGNADMQAWADALSDAAHLPAKDALPPDLEAGRQRMQRLDGG